MRSIRLSLLIYFLLLLAVALGVFSFFAYDSMRRSQLAKNARTRTLLEDRYKLTEKTLRTNFDESLLLRAQTVARNLTRQTPFRRPERGWHLLTSYQTVLNHSSPAGTGVALLPIIPFDFRFDRAMPYFVGQLCWNAIPTGPTIPYPIQWRADIVVPAWPSKTLRPGSLSVFSGDELLTHRDDQVVTEYYQVFNDKKEPLLAPPAPGAEQLPHPSETAEQLALLHHEFRDVQLATDKKGRLVTLKTPVARLHFPWYSPGRGRDRTPPRPRIAVMPADQKDVEEGRVPIVFVEYARQTTEIDDALADLRADLDETIAGLDQDLQTSLTSLRTKFGLTGLAVFGAILLGGIWLVHRGLVPIRRITDAVSQVSERDFNLHLERKEVPVELESIVEKLQQTLGSLGRAFDREKQAAADISHELRTPISALMATTQVCLKKPRTLEEYRDTLETCLEISQQLSVLVEGLLVLARLDAGRDNLTPESVDVPELASQCVSMVKPLADARGLRLHLDRNGPAVLKTDPNKLREIVTNLLHNAIQYNKPNGSIEVGVERDNGHVKLEVRDTGIGINPQAREHLFERFYRADPSRQSDTIHAGLGLSIVKGYLDLMGGRIEVDSVEGQGSTFRVWLPAAEEAQAQSPWVKAADIK